MGGRQFQVRGWLRFNRRGSATRLTCEPPSVTAAAQERRPPGRRHEGDEPDHGFPSGARYWALYLCQAPPGLTMARHALHPCPLTHAGLRRSELQRARFEASHPGARSVRQDDASATRSEGEDSCSRNRGQCGKGTLQSQSYAFRDYEQAGGTGCVMYPDRSYGFTKTMFLGKLRVWDVMGTG
jgi:hypothetical protein